MQNLNKCFMFKVVLFVCCLVKLAIFTLFMYPTDDLDDYGIVGGFHTGFYSGYPLHGGLFYPNMMQHGFYRYKPFISSHVFPYITRIILLVVSDTVRPTS
ncbi:hypothetical protein ACJMK2_005831 [Sinanodonta woodiana]|uniref:Uncharacterized protein n=1 Tax=Sinanodonta woodiana TaxID=1069815 RepID=A0ABD3VRC3_SINWO